MTFDEFLVALSEKVGARIEDDAGTCVVEVDGRQVIFRNVPDSGELLTFAEIGVPPAGTEATIAQAALAGNHLFIATAGATLSREAATGKLCLARRDPIDLMPFERWWTSFGAFLATRDAWRAFLEGSVPAAAASYDTPGMMAV